MEELEFNDLFDDTCFAAELDEYLTTLFEELDRDRLCSNCNNFTTIDE